jgi:hypothetical protein
MDTPAPTLKSQNMWFARKKKLHGPFNAWSMP